MALTPMQFDPVNGLLNTTAYKTVPENELDARAQIQEPLDQLRDALNVMIGVLNNKVSPTSASQNLGSAPITNVTGDTIYAQLVSLKAQIDAATLGSIPDGSLTNAKFADATIALAKISPTLDARYAKQTQMDIYAEDLVRLTFKLYITSDIPELATELGVDGYLYDYFKTTGMIDTVNSNVVCAPVSSGGSLFINNVLAQNNAPATPANANCYIGDFKVSTNTWTSNSGIYQTDYDLALDTHTAITANNNTNSTKGEIFTFPTVQSLAGIRVNLGPTHSWYSTFYSGDFFVYVYTSTDNLSYTLRKTYTRAQILAGVNELISFVADVKYIKIETNSLVAGSGYGFFTVKDIQAYKALGAPALVTVSKDIGVAVKRVDLSIMSNSNSHFTVQVSVDGGTTYTNATFETVEAWSFSTSRYEHKFNSIATTAGQNLKIKIQSEAPNENTIVYGWYALGSV